MNSNSIKTRTITVDSSKAGLIIGKGGETVKSISKSAGHGCRIRHENDKPGTFSISAWKLSAIQIAELKIKELIKQSESRPMKRPRNTFERKVVSTNSFNSLQEQEDPINQRTVETRPRIEPSLGWQVQGTIQQRKKAKWLEHHASEDERLQHRKKDKTTKQKDYSFSGSEFPTMGKATSKPTLSLWGKVSETVKVERPKTPPVVVEKENNLMFLDKNSIKTKGEKVEYDFSPPKLLRTNQMLSSDTEIKQVNDAWSEDEDDGWEFSGQTSFWDEDDHTLVECA